jgi:hypothetical protein
MYPRVETRHLETLLSFSFVRRNLSVIFISRVYKNKITKKMYVGLKRRLEPLRLILLLLLPFWVVVGHVGLRAGVEVESD